ncbi:hypothetical protein MyNCGM683_07940 [Achromobacter xylosoxidans]
MMVLDWLLETSIYAVSRRLGLSWRAIDGILRRAVTRGAASARRCQRCRCEKLQSVSMDMSAAYIKAALDSLPGASAKVAFDHFHVAKALSEAVDNTRKCELHRVDYGLRREIHRSRYD